jgi:Tfp pilus assembly protein PilN
VTASVVLQKLSDMSSGSLTRAAQAAGPLWKMLTLSLADMAILPKRGLSLSIEPASLSLVYGSRFLSRIRIKGARTYPFEEGRYPSPAHLASTAVLARSEMKASRPVITLSIPKAWAVVRSVELPVTVKESLVNVISYELDRLTPFTPETALYDYRVIGEEGGKLRIMLVAARVDLVNPYLDAFRERRIAVDRVTVFPSAMATVCSFVHSPQSAIFVNINMRGYEGGYTVDGALFSVFAGGFDGADETANAERVTEEINRCSDTAKKEGGSPLVIVSSDQGNEAAALKKSLTSTVDMRQGMDGKLRLARGYESIPPSAVGGLLEALWPKAQGFNLLQRGVREKRKTPVLFTIFLVALLVAMGILCVIAPLRIEERRMQEIDRRIAAIRGEVKNVEALKKEVDSLEAEIATIGGFKKGRPMTLQMVKELTTILPKSAWLTRVRITETTAEIEGYAASATELLPKLEASPLLKKVEFSSPTFRDARLNSDRFVIKMEIEGSDSEGKAKK